MATRNRDIVSILNEVADLLAIQHANSFRVRSYRSAARTVGGLEEQVSDLVDEGRDLTDLPDIGESIARKLEEIVRTGDLEQRAELREELDEHVTELLDVENVGPATARTLFRELGVTDPESLAAAAEEGTIAGLAGFGEKKQARLLRDAKRYLERGVRERVPLGEADALVAPLLDYLNGQPGVRRAVAAGSYRRRKSTIGDLDVVAVCDDRDEAMRAFVDYERVASVVSRGETRSTVVLESGLHVDLRAVGEESFGSALYYFTGSREHNIATRRIAQDRGLKINEYGVFRDDEQIAGPTEASIFETINLAFIVPELRENRGEVEAAARDELPDLVEREDIRGDLHTHTNATDGKNSVREMAEAGARAGYEYLAITDHSRRVRMAGGLDPDAVDAQRREIDEANERLDGITVLSGIEVDILEDGSLDLPDETLAELDVVVAAVHYDRDMSESRMTDRVVRAITSHPVTVLGHPTGRMVASRDPYPIDLAAVVEAAVDAKVALELNGNPKRLDLSDQAVRMAADAGAMISISTDAHSTGNLALMRYGVDTARRGWIEPACVLNTLPLDELRARLPGGARG